jgi:hypothetical protein
MSNPTIAALMRRLDNIAYDQLCAEVARLGEENERLRRELSWAVSCADNWREDAMNLHEQLALACGGSRGITQSGELVVHGGTNA